MTNVEFWEIFAIVFLINIPKKIIVPFFPFLSCYFINFVIFSKKDVFHASLFFISLFSFAFYFLLSFQFFFFLWLFLYFLSFHFFSFSSKDMVILLNDNPPFFFFSFHFLFFCSFFIDFPFSFFQVGCDHLGYDDGWDLKG